jgi:UDP-MurNAc hydroxylase
VQITVLGHAGLLVKTRFGSVLCDPWFEPAFFGAWFPFPRNDQLPEAVLAEIERADYLYISHRHGDHFDTKFLASHVDRAATVLLPDFPTKELEAELRALGFDRMVHTRSGMPIDVDGLEVMIVTEVAVADGPQGDSAITISDGDGRIFNQNDCRPHDFDVVRALGDVDAHFLQFSGAIWYPMVYEMPPGQREALGVSKREAQLRRALKYVQMLGATAVIPSAGPPCFLDPELMWLNDLGDPSNIFPDQSVFLDRLRDEGANNGLSAIAGTVLTVERGKVTAEQPPGWEAPFTDKASYLARYQSDWRTRIDAERAGWPAPRPDLVGRLARWFEPLLDVCPHVRTGVGAGVLLRAGDEDVYIDFPMGQVRPWNNEEYGFRFEIERSLVEAVVETGAVDWSNALFLSCRFRAWRAGDYNEFVYHFFKSLSPDRMARAEAEAIDSLGVDAQHERIELGGWEVQRYCPHREADLSMFGDVCDGVLTCHLHGWRFDLDSGECLTSGSGRSITAKKIDT